MWTHHPVGIMPWVRSVFFTILAFALNAVLAEDAKDKPALSDSEQHITKKTEKTHDPSRPDGSRDNKNDDKKNSRVMFMGPGAEPWITDGTDAGSFRVKDIGINGSSFPYGFTEFNGEFYFEAVDDSHGFELWKSDGTEAGTVMVKDINPGPGSSLHYRYTDFAEYQGVLYFQATDGVHGYELWRTDGTAAGTMMVEDINYILPGADSLPADFTIFKGVLYFSASHGVGGRHLRHYNGVGLSGLVNDQEITGMGSFAPDDLPGRFPILNGELYYAGRDRYDNKGFELWKTDGINIGVLVKEINPASGLGSNPAEFAILNNDLYFTADDAVHGPELWKTGGSDANTFLVKDIFNGVSGSRIINMLHMQDKLYFQAYEPVYGYELWRTDGSEAGTVMVKDISIENGGSFSDYEFSDFTTLDNELYFLAKDNVNGQRYWKSDGTAEGTVEMVRQITGFKKIGVTRNAIYYVGSISGQSGLWAIRRHSDALALVKGF